MDHVLLHGLGRSKKEEDGLHQHRFNGLADRMKAFETVPLSTPDKIDATLPYIIRVDGKKFSSFTAGLIKPFDNNMHFAMRQTTIDMMVEFNPTTIQSHSDEISLIFIPQLDKQGRPCGAIFGGRATKSATLVASFAAARLNHHLRLQDWTSGDGGSYDPKSYDPSIVEKMTSGQAYFDGRIFNIPLEEVANYVIWRSIYDCSRNSIEGLARKYFTTRELHGKCCGEMLKMLKDEKNVVWDDEPLAYRHGFFIKKERIGKQVESFQKSQAAEPVLVNVLRTRPVVVTRVVTYETSMWITDKYLLGTSD